MAMGQRGGAEGGTGCWPDFSPELKKRRAEIVREPEPRPPRGDARIDGGKHARANGGMEPAAEQLHHLARQSLGASCA